MKLVTRLHLAHILTHGSLWLYPLLPLTPEIWEVASIEGNWAPLQLLVTVQPRKVKYQGLPPAPYTAQSRVQSFRKR